MHNQPVQPTIRVEVERLNEAAEVGKPMSKQVQIEPALHESEGTLHCFVEYMPVSVAMLNKELRYLATSRQWRKDYHLPVNDWRDRSVYDIFQDRAQEWQALYEHCLRIGIAAEQDDWLVRADGTVEPVRWKIQPWRNSRGDVGGLIVVREAIAECVAQSEAFHRTQLAMDRAADAIVWVHLDGQLCYVNDAACRDLGYSKAELLSMNLDKVDADLNPTLWLERYQNLSVDQPSRFETRHLRKDGQSFPVEVSVNALVFNGVEYRCAFARDISDRKQAEALLQNAKEQLLAVLDAVPGLVSWMGSDLRYLGVNRHLAAAFNLPPERFIGHEVGFMESRPGFAEFVRQFFISPNRTLSEELCVGIEGARRNYLIVAQKYNRDRAAVFVGLDITERKTMEAELHRTQLFLNSVLENLPVAVYIKQASDLRFVFWNKSAEDLFGYTSAEVIGKNEYDIFSAEQADALTANDRQVLWRGKLLEIPSQSIQTRHRGLRILQAKKIPLFDANGEPEYLLAIAQDITEHQLAVEALRQSEAENRALLNAMPDLMFRYSKEGLYLDFIAAPNVETFAPAQEFLGKNVQEVLPAVVAEQILSAIERSLLTGETQIFEYQLQLRGNPRDYEARLVVSGKDEVLAIVRDITDRKQAEAALRQSEERFRQQAQQLELTLQELQTTQSQLIHTEKMSSLGQLVAGVAHEINNPVSFIHGNIAYARKYTQDLLKLVELYTENYPQPTPPIQEHIDYIGLDFLSKDFPKLLSSMQVGADRIREVVLSLRNFSRIDESQKKPVDLHEGIDSTLLILQNRLKAKAGRPGIEVIKEYGQLPRVECYPGQINQVFMNLLANAIDSLEAHKPFQTRHYSSQRNHGSLQEWKASVNLEPSASAILHIRTSVLDSERVEIRITDNGAGMSEEVRERLFEPFYTTKPRGKGTGLGLSISYQIVVEKHGGQLTCHSAPGQGAEFVIQLPIENQHLQLR